MVRLESLQRVIASVAASVVFGALMFAAAVPVVPVI